jgi:fumarate reductase subunit C
MADSSGARRPYQQALSRSWWLKHSFFIRYMLREATVLPLLFFCGCLLVGLYSLSQGETQYQSWLLFMAQPWVVALNTLVLLASLYHAKTFFELFPRVMPLMIAGQWCGTALVAALLLWLLGAR